MRFPRAAATGLLAGIVAVTILGGSAQGAESGDALKVFGYITDARSAPIAIEYDQPSFGVPATPTFEMRFIHSETEADGGPSGRGLSSVFWPGDLAGNAPPGLIIDTFVPADLIDTTDAEDAAWTPIRQGLIDGSQNFPSYPIRAESFYPAGPEQKVSDLGGGVTMASTAHERQSTATTTGSKAGVPGLFSARHMNSTAFSGIRNGIAVSEATAEIRDLNMFDGLITLKDFQANRTAVSDGVKGTLDGSIDLSGLTIAGVPVFGVDPAGPRLGDNSIPWDQAMKAIHDYLEPQGISVTFLQDDDSTDAAAASSRLTGIKIRMDSHAMKAFADSLPEPLRTLATDPGSSALAPLFDQLPTTANGLVNSIVQFDQSMTIILGDVRVNSNASPPFTISDPIIPPIQPPVTPVLPPPVVLAPGGPATPTIEPPTTPTGSFAPPLVPVAARAVPFGIKLLVFLLAAAGAAGMRMLADRATVAAAAAGSRCTLEA